MKMRQILLVALLATVLLAGGSLAVAAVNSGYTLDWFTVDGGGGTSSQGGAGGYSVSGTIGQPDAGTLHGGSYVLNGGFWSGGTNLYLPLVRR